MRRELRWGAGAILLAGVSGVVRPHPGLPFEARQVQLDPADGTRAQVGALSWRGGLHLRAADPAFGGLSGMEVAPDGTLVAISDRGGWFRLRLSVEGGRLAGAEIVGQGLLRGDDGLLGGRVGDAESITAFEGQWLVGFEGDHRILAFSELDAPGARFEGPDLVGLGRNKGIEALVTLNDEVLALAEGGGRGWRGRPGAWRSVRWPLVPPFVPTAATALGDGYVVVERAYDPVRGVRIRVLQVEDAEAADPVELARLAAPLTVDNLEAAAVHVVDGEPWLLLLSDDNFRDAQRTLLLAFALVDGLRSTGTGTTPRP